MSARKHLKTAAVVCGGILVAVIVIPLVLLMAVSIYRPAIGPLLGIFKAVTGIAVTVDDISFGFPLSAGLSGLSVGDEIAGTFFFASDRTEVGSGVGAALRGEVEHLSLQGPRVTLRLKKKESEAGEDFLGKIPPVGSLKVSGGEMDVFLEEEGLTVRMRDVAIEMVDVSPRGGGRGTVSGALVVTSADASGVQAEGRFTGRLSLSRLSPFPEGTGEIEMILDRFVYEPALLRKVSLRFTAVLERETIALRGGRVKAEVVEYQGDKGRVGVGEVGAAPTGHYNLSERAFTVSVAEGVIGEAGEFSGNVKGVLSGEYPWQASFKAAGLSFPELHRIVSPFLDPSYGEWTIQGRGSASAEMKGHYREGRFSGEGRLSLTMDGGGFVSPDGAKAAQGASGSAVIRLKIPADGGRRQAEVSSRLSVGELLWGAYYHDFRGASLSLSSRGEFSGMPPSDIRGSGTFDLFSTGGYSFSGGLTEGVWRVAIAFSDVRLGELALFVVPGIVGEGESPLRGLAIEGLMQGDAALSGDGEGFVIVGRVLLRGGSVAIPASSVTVSEIDLDAPIDLGRCRRGGCASPAGDGGQGYLRVGRFDAGRLAASGLHIPFTVSHNSVGQMGTLDVPFFGGRLQIDEMRAFDPIGPDMAVSLALSIRGADLGSMVESDIIGPVTGSLEAVLHRILYRNGRWTAEGRVDLNVFDGTVRIAGLYGERLLSSSRKVGADIVFERISLESLTKTLGTGSMSGVIRGGLDGFEMEYGQPSRFVFVAESVKTPGVDQRVSVDAIENISVLGTGSGGMGTVLRSGINRFFREYPYSRLGITCRLENDLFTIRGTIHEGGKEYLIRRGLFRGVDVVNQNPDNVIGFRDMRERVSRIFSKDSPAEIRIN